MSISALEGLDALRNRTAGPAGKAASSALIPRSFFRRAVAAHRRKLAIGIALAVVAALGALGFHANRAAAINVHQPLVFYSVERGDLSITVTERGNLESQQETRILCEVETVGNNSGTRIVWMVPNGKSVKQGELLVELDSAPIKDRLDNQVVTHEQARASQVQATAKYENQKTQNETALAAAKLRVELAKLAQQMYEDKEEGTYQITRQDLQVKIQEAKNQIIEAQAGLLLQATARSGMEMLHKLGYRGKGDVDQAVFKSIQAEDTLVKATNNLGTAMAEFKKFEEFEHRMKQLELDGALKTAERELVQVERDNQSVLAQAEAAKVAADRALAKEDEKRRKYESLLAKCKIMAPHDGLVVYSTERTPWGVQIGEGVLVVERTRLLTLPDLTRMQVKTSVHESVLDQVREGLPATVRIDAFADRTYPATVGSVAVLPAQSDRFFSSDVKVYETIVRIDEQVGNLKPGMTAVVQIHVDRLKDVLTVPVQAVVQVDDQEWCYVETESAVERRRIKLGRTNDKFVQVLEGLEEGQRVVLNPMAIVDQETGSKGEKPAGPERTSSS